MNKKTTGVFVVAPLGLELSEQYQKEVKQLRESLETKDDQLRQQMDQMTVHSFFCDTFRKKTFISRPEWIRFKSQESIQLILGLT